MFFKAINYLIKSELMRSVIMKAITLFSFSVAMILVRTFVTTPLYCYVLKMHDCMLTITGMMVNIESAAVSGTASVGWHMYYGASLTVVGALDSTPLR